MAHLQGMEMVMVWTCLQELLINQHYADNTMDSDKRDSSNFYLKIKLPFIKTKTLFHMESITYRHHFLSNILTLLML